MTDETPLPGSPMLQGYLDSAGLSLRGFCQQHNLNPSEISKLIRGKRQRVSVQLAASIETATNGAVPMRAWVP